MATEVLVNDLKINTLTKAQYEASSKSETELWLVEDESVAKTPNTMPVLLASGWTLDSTTGKYTQTVAVQGVTSTGTVFTSPAPAYALNYSTNGIVCTTQATNSLTFTCETVPTNDITVNIVIMDSRPAGITPAGAITITTNGTYDVTDKAAAIVNTPSPTRYVEYEVSSGILQKSTNTPFMDLTGVTTISSYALYYVYQGNNPNVPQNVDMSNITHVYERGMEGCFFGSSAKTINLSGLTTVYANSFNQAFSESQIESIDLSGIVDCLGTGHWVPSDYGFNAAFGKTWSGGNTSLTSVNLSSLTTLDGSNWFLDAFKYCTLLTSVGGSGSSVNLSSLTTVSGGNSFYNAFQRCEGLISFSLPSLTTLSGTQAMQNCCSNCTSLTTVNLNNLITLTGNVAMRSCFTGCTSLTSVTIGGTTAIDFGTNKSQFQSMFSGCSQNITLNIATTEATLSQFTDYDTSGNGHHFGCTGVVTINYLV